MGLTYSPYDNLYMDAASGGSGEYGSRVFVMRDSSRTPLPLPVFNKQSYFADTAWKLLGRPVRHDTLLGFAHYPVIMAHKGSLYLAFTEYRADYNNGGTPYAGIKRWSGTSWDSVGYIKVSYNNFHQFISLYSDGVSLYIGDDNEKIMRGSETGVYHRNMAGVYRIGDNGFKNVGSIASWDQKSLPHLVRFKGKLHAIHCGLDSGDYDSLYYCEFDSMGGRWDASKAIAGNIKRSPFSAVAKGDSLLVATTDVYPEAGTYPYFFNRPFVVNVRFFDGANWGMLPPVNASRDTMFCSHPTLAANPDGRELYIAYLKRPWYGRRNNEVFVEKWTGSVWQPMGGSLNVNGQDKDAWSYRPCIIVNSKGVPYVAWNEHVWGSCAQVYVKHWDGSSWVSDVKAGASLNVDGRDGAAQSVTITMLNDTPVVAWSEYSFGKDYYRRIMVKSLGCVAGPAVETSPAVSQPVSLTLSPNPFNPTLNIAYTLSRPMNVTISVFDVSGKRVARLPQGIAAAGYHALSWSAGKMGSGIYTIVLESPGSRICKKVLLIK